ncbi:MAG: peptidylprolyl isomerase, partial [Pseudomonadota bacterium]
AAWPQSETPAGPGTVLATVNGVEITMGHLAHSYQGLPQQFKQLPDGTIFQGLLEQLIDQQLLSAETAEAPAAVERQLDNQRRQLFAQTTIEAVTGAEITPASASN